VRVRVRVLVLVRVQVQVQVQAREKEMGLVQERAREQCTQRRLRRYRARAPAQVRWAQRLRHLCSQRPDRCRPRRRRQRVPRRPRSQ